MDGFFKISNNLKASFNFLLDKGTPAFYIYMQMEFKDLKLPKESPDTYVWLKDQNLEVQPSILLWLTSLCLSRLLSRWLRDNIYRSHY